MATLSSRQDALDKFAAEGYSSYMSGLATGGTTTGATGSNNLTIQAHFNTLGTTLYSTLVGYPAPAGNPSPLRLIGWEATSNRVTIEYLVRYYRIGTIDTTSTSGNRFTHDAATFPLLRTRMGQASQPIPLIPVVLITTAQSAGVAPVFTMGYTSQSGASRTGTRTFTMPSATAAVGSIFALPMEEGDSGVRDISTVTVTTASTTGPALTVYGVEIYAAGVMIGVNQPIVRNTIVNSPSIPDISEAVATSGTVTSILAHMNTSNAATSTANGAIKAVYDV